MAETQKKSKLTKKPSIQSSQPNVNGKNGAGQFTKGNKAATGHSTKAIEKAKDFKRIFQDAVTCADMKAIAKKMVVLAKKGNVKATKEVLDRCMGKAMQAHSHSGSLTLAMALAGSLNGE